jgi:hypothetical protein
MATIYFFTLGLGTPGLPACGDLMMSGHTTFQLCLALFSMETMGSIVSSRKVTALGSMVAVLVTTSSLYEIGMRNEYSISVLLGISFIGLAWVMYGNAQGMYYCGYGPFLTSFPGRIFAWIEEDAELFNMEEEEGPSSNI